MNYIERDTKAFIIILVLMNISVFFTQNIIHVIIYTVLTVGLVGYMLYKDITFLDLKVRYHLTPAIFIYYFIILLLSGPIVEFTKAIGIYRFIILFPMAAILFVCAFFIFDGYRKTSTDINDYHNSEDGHRVNMTTAHTYTNQGSGRGGTNWAARANMQEDLKQK